MIMIDMWFLPPVILYWILVAVNIGYSAMPRNKRRFLKFLLIFDLLIMLVNVFIWGVFPWMVFA